MRECNRPTITPGTAVLAAAVLAATAPGATTRGAITIAKTPMMAVNANTPAKDMPDAPKSDTTIPVVASASEAPIASEIESDELLKP